MVKPANRRKRLAARTVLDELTIADASRKPDPYADLPRAAIRCTCGSPVGDSYMRCTICFVPICMDCGLFHPNSICRGPHAEDTFTIDPRFLI
jgi:hypothetical protein